MEPWNPAVYPTLLPGGRRELIFTTLEEKHIAEFKAKGYDIVLLLTLPRYTKEEELRYLRYKARGIEEGTVDVSQNQLDILKLEFKAAGLLDENRGSAEDEAPVAEEVDVFSLITDFDPSRHTTDQSTINLVKGGPDEE